MRRSKNDAQRKAMWANIKNGGVTLKNNKGWSELPDPFTGKAPNHQLVALKTKTKNSYNNTLIRPLLPQKQTLELVFCKAGTFAVPLMFSLTGLEDSLLIGKACVSSFEDSLKTYRITKNVDNAVICGIKSFVKNYSLDKAEINIMNDVLLHKNDTDKEFEAILEGTISISTVYALMENI